MEQTQPVTNRYLVKLKWDAHTPAPTRNGYRTVNIEAIDVDAASALAVSAAGTGPWRVAEMWLKLV